MASSLFDLYFSGKIIANEDPALVQARVGKLFSADERMLRRLFSGNPVRIKAGVDQEEAIRYRVALRDCGALLEIRTAESEDRDETRIAAKPAKESLARDQLTLLPANTGSLADCAPVVRPQKIPDISAMQLSPPGSDIDTSQPPPPAAIASDRFTMTEPHSGTLEDCRREQPPEPIPDISHLKITST
ncbi:MAG: hypothetical protein KDI68_04145 [Gammaproteobacteria bacterium]|nr:hypothetical protein [Gammaproteobacteria bacterium]